MQSRYAINDHLLGFDGLSKAQWTLIGCDAQQISHKVYYQVQVMPHATHQVLTDAYRQVKPTEDGKSE